jgi:hypothetical protein
MAYDVIATPFCRFYRCAFALAALGTLFFALSATGQPVAAEGTAAAPTAPSTIQVVDPFGPIEPEADPFENERGNTPVNAADYVPPRNEPETKQINFQGPAISTTEELPAKTTSQSPTANEPCAAARFRPLNEIGIGIQQPGGQSPTDFATDCWAQINSGPNAYFRAWPMMVYNWEPTCLCYQPLYFEEINAERYGYICNDYCCGYCCMPGNCMQSAASAAHFFGTIPCLPYCLSAECPTECVYTLGHYRPGSCPPWRWHWPPCDPYAAATCAGVYTGFIFAIP